MIFYWPNGRIVQYVFGGGMDCGYGLRVWAIWPCRHCIPLLGQKKQWSRGAKVWRESYVGHFRGTRLVFFHWPSLTLVSSLKTYLISAHEHQILWLHPFVASCLLPLLAKICTYFCVHHTSLQTTDSKNRSKVYVLLLPSQHMFNSHTYRLVWHSCEPKTKWAHRIQALRPGGP